MPKTIPGGPLTPADAYLLACELAGVPPPTTAPEAEVIAEKATNKLKTRAELLAKAMPFPFDHATCLRILVAMHGSSDWYDWTSTAKRFVQMSAGERPNHLKSAQLVVATLGPFDLTAELHPYLLNIHRGQTAILAEVLECSVAEAQVVFDRITFVKGAVSRPADSSYYGRDEIVRALGQYLTFGPKRQILALLARVPVAAGLRAKWPQLAAIQVRDLLTMALANRDNEAGFDAPGWVHLGADLTEQMTHYGRYRESERAARQFDDPTYVRTPQDVLEKKAFSTGTLVALREAAEDMLRPLVNHSVLDALTTKPNAKGFFTDWSVGTREEVRSRWLGYWEPHLEEGILQMLADGEPFHGYDLTLFRFNRPMESAGDQFEEIEAVLHGPDGRAAAYVSMGLLAAGSGTLGDFLWATDEVGHEDIVELGMSLGVDFDTAHKLEGKLKRVAVLRNWEVHTDLRGRGLGRMLLDEVVSRCFKGRTKPLLMVRLAPAQFEVPILSDWTAEHLFELTGPHQRLRKYWDTEVAPPGSVVATRFRAVHHYPHAPIAWADDAVVRFMLGQLDHAFTS